MNEKEYNNIVETLSFSFEKMSLQDEMAERHLELKTWPFIVTFSNPYVVPEARISDRIEIEIGSVPEKRATFERLLSKFFDIFYQYRKLDEYINSIVGPEVDSDSIKYLTSEWEKSEEVFEWLEAAQIIKSEGSAKELYEYFATH